VKEHFFEPASADLVAEIDSIARRHGSREQVFDDLLTIAVCALAGGTREEEYLQTVKPYIEGDVGNRAIDRLVAVFGQIVIIMDETRSDVLGDIFQGAITRGQNQQFFTPDPICDLMARLTDSAESREGASAGSADAAEMKTICDPCCGSGRLLLAAARVNRNRYFVGQDIDHRCAKITAINLALWNLYGKVVWGNTLTNEVRRIYHTGFNGQGVIRIEDVQAPGPPDQLAAKPDPLPDPEPPNPSPRQGTLFDDPPLE
jgi:hypothetical protein